MSAGKAVYEAFTIGRNGYDPGFRFEGLSDEGKAAWEVAAQAAIEWYKANNVVVPGPAECYSCKSSNGAPCYCDELPAGGTCLNCQ